MIRVSLPVKSTRTDELNDKIDENAARQVNAQHIVLPVRALKNIHDCSLADKRASVVSLPVGKISMKSPSYNRTAIGKAVTLHSKSRNQ